ncbi:MAG: DNA polymerase III subunit delta' [Chitinophagales bacterium]
MRFGDLLGQEKNIRLLREAVRRDRAAHAYLFAGPPGSGKRSLALAFAAALDCEARGTAGWDGEPCGECRSCRKMASGNHPDLQVIEPDGARLKIEQMREVRRENARRPYEARHKVFLIAGAETLTDEAANSLLKALEEPPGPAVFLLLTTHVARLLPTIVSRCCVVKLTPLPEATIAQALAGEGVEPGVAAAAAALSGGALGRAREVAESWDEWRDEARRFYDAAHAGDRVALLQLAAAWAKDRDVAAARLTLLEGLYRQLLHAAGGASAGPLLLAAGLKPPQGGAGAGISLAGARQALESIMWTEQALLANAHRRLLLEVLFLQIARCHRGEEPLPGLAGGRG